MTDVDLLKRAVAKLREAAGAATPGPWTFEAGNDGMDESIGAGDVDSPDVVMLYSHYGLDDVGIALGPKDGSYVALMDPTVAVALAEWLEAFENVAGSDDFADAPEALSVARAVLREGGES